MSYCRFSCDDWTSDVYCYQSTDDCYVTHVAGLRVVGTVPPTPPWPAKIDDVDKDAWCKQMVEAHNAQMAFLETCTRAPIGLQYDGETFVDADLADFLDRLLLLRASGYHVPDHAIDAVRAELAEQET